MDLFVKLYFVFISITLGSYIIIFNKKEKYINLVIAILALWFLTTAIAVYLYVYKGMENNLIIFHIYTPIEYSILTLLYRTYIVNDEVRKILRLSIPLFIILSIFFSIFIQTPKVSNSYITIIESLLLILISLFFLKEILLLQQIQELHRFPMFWISVGILFYYTGTLITEGMLNYLISHSIELARRIYRISYLIKYILFILFIIGAFCNKSISFPYKKTNN